jgi:diketogulonate reductase-like aldo/keto reductase
MISRRHFLAASAAAAVAAMSPDLFAADAPPQGTMLMRRIPATGQEVPAIGLGTFKALMTNGDLSDAALNPRVEALKIFYDAGGRVIDTAPSYGNAEEVAGILTTKLGINDKVFIATKVLEEAGGEQAGIDSYNRSLQRLKRGKLELMQCHNFINWDIHLKTMRQWKEEGKFRYIGVTHYQDHAHEELERIIKKDKVDFLQINYSAAETKAAGRLLPLAKDLGVAVLINRPFAAGELFKRVSAKPLPDEMKPFAETWAAAFLKFVLANDAVTSVIGATGDPNHMRENVAAGFGPLPDDAARKALIAAIG